MAEELDDWDLNDKPVLAPELHAGGHRTKAHEERTSFIDPDAVLELQDLSARIVADAVKEVRDASRASFKDLAVALHAFLEEHRDIVDISMDRVPQVPTTCTWPGPGEMLHPTGQTLRQTAPANASETGALAEAPLANALVEVPSGTSEHAVAAERVAVTFPEALTEENAPNPEAQDNEEAPQTALATNPSATKILQRCLSRHHELRQYVNKSVTTSLTNSIQTIHEAYRHAVGEQRRQTEEKLAEDTSMRWARKLLKSHYFHNLVNLIIMINAVTIGMEIDLGLRNERSDVLSVLEHVFLAFYIFELGLSFYAFGFSVLKGPHSGAIWFDCALVMIGIFTSWVAVPIMQFSASSASSDSGSVVSIMEQIMIFRMLRILRLARALRLLGYFETLAKFVDGMLSSLSTMLSALVIMAMVIYLLACLAAELITKSPELNRHPETGLIIVEQFDTLPSIMITLMQFTTTDSISAFYKPIIEQSPFLALYFLVCFVVVSILLMNLVAAIVLEDALYRGAKDQERENALTRRKIRIFRPWLDAVFEELDTEADGELELHEIIRGMGDFHKHPDIPAELAAVLHPNALVDFFEFLDNDGSGVISKEEFVDGVTHLALSGVPVETSQMLQLLRSERKQLAAIQTNVEKVHMSMHHLLSLHNTLKKSS